MTKFLDNLGFKKLGGKDPVSNYRKPGYGSLKSVVGTVMTVVRDNKTNRSIGDILVNVVSNDKKIERIFAQPIGRHMYTCPLPNEQVHLIKNQFSGEWFYTGILSNEYNINHMLNGTIRTKRSNESNAIFTGHDFIAHPDSARAVDMFEGDTIIQSRTGASIRMSHSNPKMNNPWSIGQRKETTPIMILRTGHLPIENIQYDYSSLYLTSDQQLGIPLPTVLPDDVETTEYGKSQFIGLSDRIVLGARGDDIVLSAARNIQLCTKNWHHNVDVVLDNITELIAEVKALAAEVKAIANTSTRQTFIIPGVGTTGTTTQMGGFVNSISKVGQIEQRIQQIDNNIDSLAKKT